MAMIESLKSAKNGQIGPIFFLPHKFAVNFLSESCVYPKKMLFLRAYYVDGAESAALCESRVQT